MASMIGRLHHLIMDCPDPLALATFYSDLLGQPITYRSEDFVVVADNDTTSGLAFQLAPDHQPPAWPDPARPQQMHLDVMVEDVAEAGARVLALGATKLDGPDVYADPAGHPFCLIRRPTWAPPIPSRAARGELAPRQPQPSRRKPQVSASRARSDPSHGTSTLARQNARRPPW